MRRVVGPDDPDGVGAQGEVADPVTGVPLAAEPDHGVRVVPVAAKENVVAHGVNDRGSVVISVPVLLMNDRIFSTISLLKKYGPF